MPKRRSKSLRAKRREHQCGDNGGMGACLWTPQPEKAHASAMARFMREAGHSDYAELHRWPVKKQA